MQGSFRINVDGFSGNNFENIFIGAKDSIFIFIEVTPNLSSNNFLLENKLQFNTNGNNKMFQLSHLTEMPIFILERRIFSQMAVIL